MASCVNLGIFYDAGQGIAQDSVKGAAIFRKACDKKSAAACHYLAVLYDKGRGVTQDNAGDGVAQDKAKATELYQKACSLGYQPACKTWATHDELRRSAEAIALTSTHFRRASIPETRAGARRVTERPRSRREAAGGAARRDRRADTYTRLNREWKLVSDAEVLGRPGSDIGRPRVIHYRVSMSVHGL
jgi:hypothetical protein